MIQFPDKLEGLHIHLVGAKGTGMTALAEILQKRHAPLVCRRDLSAVQNKCCVFHAASPFPRRYLGYSLYRIVCFLGNKLLFVLYTASENCQALLLTGAEITDKI